MIAREAVPAFYHQADHQKNQTVRRWRNLESLKLRGTLRRTPRVTSLTKEPGNRQSQEGFPSDITPPEISRKRAETKDLHELNWKQVDKQISILT